IGASIIPNPYNRIAAFSCGNHHFLPGFPEMAWPMMEWVLDTRYGHLFHQQVIAEQTIIIPRAGESELIDAMDRIVAKYPTIKLSSLPQHLADGGRLIELSIRGESKAVEQAMGEMQQAVIALGYDYRHLELIGVSEDQSK
ncbi:MAG: competence/damage-inducible protein A, partial [Betaproteobacteria bacterium]|nr:competence/damage-inducible protein A [Betaproteobacteria bacterium]